MSSHWVGKTSFRGTVVFFAATWLIVCQVCAAARPPQDPPAIPTTAPFSYVPATAYYILPETHNNQSGYFSLSEGLDGNLHVGTCAYGENAYLVEFDPTTESQRIVIDTNKVCKVSGKGYAAQAKIHTRNFVGPSGVVYVGSKQGYRMDESDTSEYPGGFVMSYDPRTGQTKNLGMPYPGQGIADVTVDEARGLSYVVTCEDQHWMLGDLSGGPYRELGPMLTPYAMTLIAADGKAYAITSDFQLASYDPEQNNVEVRPIHVDGQRWTRANDMAIPTWVLTADRTRAYLILLNDTSLLEIPLTGTESTVAAINRGKLLNGSNPDCRCGLDLGADGNVYAVIRVDNETGFGTGYLHHLTRYQPATGAIEDLGVLAVSNPDFFAWDQLGPDGQPQKWTHGFHKLPDGTLTILHVHMSLKVAADNTIYITTIYPFTLLKIDAYKMEQEKRPSELYLDWAENLTLQVEQDLSRVTEVAERIADRHIRGGAIGFPFVQHALAQELHGRSGGMVHIGFDRVWKQDRTDAEKANDVAIVGYDSAPGENDLAVLQELKARGVMLVGFGPRSDERLSAITAICDAWFDTGLGSDDRVVQRSDGSRAGRGNTLANAVQGITLIAEVVGALTRSGKMPTMWKAYAYDDGVAWGEKYFLKTQFHDDYQVPALEPGELGQRFLTQIRYPIRRLRLQADSLQTAAATVASEVAAGRTVFVAWQGHMPLAYVAKQDDAAWAQAVEFHPFLESQVNHYRSTVPDGAMVLSLGYHGIDPIQARVFQEKNNRVIHLAGQHSKSDWQPGAGLLQNIDLGYAFGDACVTIDGYPLCLFAPSGIAQAAAYQAIQAELTTTAK